LRYTTPYHFFFNHEPDLFTLTPYQNISLMYILIVSCNLRLGLPSDLFPHGFPTNHSTQLFCPHSCPGHIYLLDFLAQSVSDKHTTFIWLSLSREAVSLSGHPLRILSWLQMIGEARFTNQISCPRVTERFGTKRAKQPATLSTTYRTFTFISVVHSRSHYSGPWNRILNDKLTVAQLVKKFPDCYGTHRTYNIGSINSSQDTITASWAKLYDSSFTWCIKTLVF
jgi:hypothetical protein